jgi:DNA-binding MarR family transcriptional regulator
MNHPSRLHACNCFAARQAARGISKSYERHLSGAGVTITQFAILVLPTETPGMTMNDPAQAMVIDRTTLVRNIKPLQRDGLLLSVPSSGNAQRRVLALSRAGAEKLPEASPLWELAQEAFESEVGPKRAAKLRRDLLDLTR